MTAVAVGLQIWNLTNSSMAVGLVGLFQLVPLIVLGLWGGSLSDAYDRRLVGLLSAIGLWTCSTLFLVQSLAGWGSVPILYAIIAVQSGFFAIGNPARGAIIPRLVPASILPSANALGLMTWSIGFTLGPLLGGIVIAATGTVSSAYALDVLAFLTAVWAMWRLPSLPPVVSEGGTKPRAGWSAVLDGIKFLRGKRNLQMSFYVDIVAMVFGMPRALFPAIAAQWYGGSTRDIAIVLGALSAAPALGAVVVTLLSGPLRRVRRQGLAVVVSVVVWGLAIAGFGLVRWLPAAVLLLAIAGAADSVSAVFRSTILQAATPDEYRGRLQGIFTVVVAGGPRIGDVEAGLVASLGGEMLSVVSGGVVCALLAVGLLGLVPSFGKYDAHHPVA